MNYIINPSWFYWLGVVHSMRGFMLTAFIVSIIIIGVALIIIPVNVKLIRDYPSISDDERKVVRFFTKAMKVSIGVCVVGGLFLVFVPSKETLIEMMIAKQATYENATWTVDALKSAVDYVVQAIQSLK
nr:MAG TPA: hypothetical protein [Caudoviricetes sp.]